LLVFISDRNGEPEIWLKQGETERQLVGPRDFAENPTQWLMGPALSAEADRVIYTQLPRNGVPKLWISAVTGGSPVRLTNDATNSEFPGSWSPDAAWFTYYVLNSGKLSLMKVKTSGQATPELLAADIDPQNSDVPVWSPNGDWILYGNHGKKILISPDGKTSKATELSGNTDCTFSADGASLYCLRAKPPAGELISVNLTSGAQRVIAQVAAELAPSSNLDPAIRLSLSPDGKSITYSISKGSSNLWLMDGLSVKPTGLLARLGWR
jgi:Tol biopolymer transport system component